MKTFKQYLNEEISPSVLGDLEKYFDKLYSSLGIDVEFTKHFHDRLNDPRNVKSISRSELNRIFVIAKKKYGKRIRNMNRGAEAVISDMETDVNMPFGIKKVNRPGGIDLQLYSKTVMRHPDFKTGEGKYRNSPKLPIGDKNKAKTRKAGWRGDHRVEPEWIKKFGTSKEKAELKAKEKAPIRGGHKLGTKIPDKLLAKMRATRQGKAPTRSKSNWTSRRR